MNAPCRSPASTARTSHAGPAAELDARRGPTGAAAFTGSPRQLAQRREIGALFGAGAALQRRAAPGGVSTTRLSPQAGVVQCDDVVEGQTDPGDLVDGVAEITEDLGELTLADSDDEMAVEPGPGQVGPNPFGLGGFGAPTAPWGSPGGFGNGGGGPFGTPFLAPPSFGLPPSSQGPSSGFQGGGQPSPFAHPGPVGPFGGFGQPSNLGGNAPFGSAPAPHTTNPNPTVSGPGFGSGFSGYATLGNPWQLRQDPAATKGVVQRIGANKVQNHVASDGTAYRFTTVAGGFVNFHNPSGGDGPALTKHADVQIEDPMYPGKLNVPPAYRRTNPARRNPPLRNKRGMHFLAANWMHNGTVSMSSPGNLTWHHHQDKGRMILIDAEVHGAIKHNGGHSTWGKK